MNKEFQNLPHQLLALKTRITRDFDGANQAISLEDSAISIMTDFNHVRPFLISASATIGDINQKMIACGVRLLFVADAHGVLQGLVTYNDLFGDKPVRYVQEHGGQHHEITTSDIMTPLSHLEALQRSDILKARIGDIVKTIKDSGRQHLLVVEDIAEGEQIVSGLFSSTHIEKQLDIKIEVSPRANTFADLERALTE